MSNTILADCAQRLLEVTVAALDDPPERQFLMDGDPLQFYSDCPFVAVGMLTGAALTQAISTRARGRSIPPRPTSKTATSIAAWNIWVVNDVCWPIYADGASLASAPPAAADDITAHAEAVLTDRMDVWSALRSASEDGTLFQGLLAGNDNAEITPPVSIISTGGTAGSILGCTADLIQLPAGS